MSAPVPVGGLIQVALAVEDIEASLDRWCALFDIERPEVVTLEPNPAETYRGQPAGYRLRLAVITVPGSQVVIELNEPDANPSTFREFLTAHGEGVHHLGFAVGDTRDAVVEGLETAGFAKRVEAYYPGGSWTVLDTEAALGVNLNIKPHA